MMSKYIREYRIDDIPKYPFLFIRDGVFVYKTNKQTGEILEALSVEDYCNLWLYERYTNKYFIKFYEKGIKNPKPSPDTAKDIHELLGLCSDRTRHRKGDDAFLLDFMWQDSATITETKLFRYICLKVEVWNYSIIDESCMAIALGKGLRHTRDTFKSLCDKGLIKLINNKFDYYGEWRSLVKIHPKLFWEGRHSAWLVAIGAEYEYGEKTKID